MDSARKNQILVAEERFELRERLVRALADRGVYLIGDLTHEPALSQVMRDQEPIGLLPHLVISQ